MKHEFDILSRKEALNIGAKFYYTGKPCVRGHYAQRRTANCNCRACEKEDSHDQYIRNVLKDTDVLKEIGVRVLNPEPGKDFVAFDDPRRFDEGQLPLAPFELDYLRETYKMPNGPCAAGHMAPLVAKTGYCTACMRGHSRLYARRIKAWQELYEQEHPKAEVKPWPAQSST